MQVSGPVGSVFEADTWAVRSSALKAGLTRSEVSQYLDLWELEVAALNSPGEVDRRRELEAAVDRAQEEKWWPSHPYNLAPQGHWWLDWYSLVNHQDSREYLPRVTAPILWFYGEHDTQLDAATSVERLRALRAKWKKSWEVRVFAEAGHSLLVPVDGLGRSTGPLSIAPSFFETLLSWLQEQTGPS